MPEVLSHLAQTRLVTPKVFSLCSAKRLEPHDELIVENNASIVV
jgi:hypothetical protein